MGRLIRSSASFSHGKEDGAIAFQLEWLELFILDLQRRPRCRPNRDCKTTSLHAAHPKKMEALKEAVAWSCPREPQHGQKIGFVTSSCTSDDAGNQ